MTALNTNSKLSSQPTAEDLEQQIKELSKLAMDKRKAEQEHREKQLIVKKAQDLETLESLKKEIRKIDAAEKLSSGKLTVEDALKLAEKREKYLEDIEEIETHWGLGTAKNKEVEATKTLYNISTTKAIWTLLGLFILSCFVTGWFGTDAISDPMNPVGQSMMLNAPLRALVAFNMTFLTLLVAVFFMWLFFNDLFILWHNRIKSERNLSTLLAEAPAWAVLFFLLGSFFLIMWLFANYYLTAYA